jgi:Zn ribbon nucleic-acid-binding protein
MVYPKIDQLKSRYQHKSGGMREMAIWKSKGCPQCNADLIIQLESDGWYEECLWCGYHRDVSKIVTISTRDQAEINGQIAIDQKLYTDVHVTLAN